MSDIAVNTNSDLLDPMDPSLSDVSSPVNQTRPQGEIKASELVLAAIHHLKESKGSSPKEIIDYIAQEYNCNSSQLKRSVQTALKRGVQYGILKYDNGNYFMQPVDDESMTTAACCKRKPRCARKKPKRSCKKKKRKSSCRRKKRRSKSCKKKRKKPTCRKKPKRCDFEEL